MSSPNALSASNFLVPAAGTTRIAPVVETLAAGTPKTVDFRDFKLDGLPFNPYGFFADNTNGTADLLIRVREVGFVFAISPGNQMIMPFPAPANVTIVLEGEGPVAVSFVDFPVTPWSSAGASFPSSISATISQYDSDGDLLPPKFDSLAKTYGYDGSNNLITETVTDGTNTWIKTYGYTGSNLTSESGWVK